MFFTRDRVTGGAAPRKIPVPAGHLPVILHVDMDAFFASVEIRSDPRLNGRALVVGGGPDGRGVVTTASYPARKYGVRSGMSLAEARRLCPGLLVLPVDPPKIIHESLRVLQAVERVCPRVEPASIDEAYLEFEPCTESRWVGWAEDRARLVQRVIQERTGLPASVGAAVGKLPAKMASAAAKPNGVLALAPDGFLQRFAGHPVGVIPGVGPQSVLALAELGVHTVGDLAVASRADLAGRFGSGVASLLGHAQGHDATPVAAAGEEAYPKSAGHETTLAHESADPAFLRATLCLLSDRVARRLRRMEAGAMTVAVRYKLGFTRFSRQRRLAEPTQDGIHLTRIAWDLLEPARRGRALRLIGVAGCELAPCSQPPLLPDDIVRERLHHTGDRLRDRFGEGVLLPAETLRRRTRRGR